MAAARGYVWSCRCSKPVCGRYAVGSLAQWCYKHVLNCLIVPAASYCGTGIKLPMRERLATLQNALIVDVSLLLLLSRRQCALVVAAGGWCVNVWVQCLITT